MPGPVSPRLARFCGLVCLLAGVFLPAAFPQTPPPPPAPQPGWTQIDVTWPGHQLNAPYTGTEGTATFDIYVKDADGKYRKKTLTLEIKQGKSVNQMAGELAAKLADCIRMGDQFSYSWVDNGITIWPVDSGADPDKEGSPGTYPKEPKTEAKVRKETHPNKK